MVRLQFPRRLSLHEPAPRSTRQNQPRHTFTSRIVPTVSRGRILRLKVGVLMRIPKTTLTFFTFALLLVLEFQGACRGGGGASRTGPLPSPPPPDQMKLSNV